MHAPSARHPRRRTRPQRRLSGLAIYLLILNIICIGMVISLHVPLGRQRLAVAAVLPTAQVDPLQPLAVPVLVASGASETPAVMTVAPAPTQAGPLQAGNVPILMYHYVRVVDAGADPMGYNLSIAPTLFDQQMQWLRDNGYATVTMATAQRCIAGEAACPPNALALTFDDGYIDAYTDVLPVLQRYGFTATFYIVNNFVGQPPYLNWEQVAALHTAGMEIGAHTLDHLDLTQIAPADAQTQIRQSKLDIEAKIGVAVNSFCYPAGRYNGDVAVWVRAAGYTNATTTRWDDDYSDIFGLPRRRIEGGKGLDVFAAAVQGE